jgi:hypothetical protein
MLFGVVQRSYVTVAFLDRNIPLLQTLIDTCVGFPEGYKIP